MDQSETSTTMNWSGCRQWSSHRNFIWIYSWFHRRPSRKTKNMYTVMSTMQLLHLFGLALFWNVKLVPEMQQRQEPQPEEKLKKASARQLMAPDLPSALLQHAARNSLSQNGYGSGFNPSKKYESNWKSSPSRGVHSLKRGKRSEEWALDPFWVAAWAMLVTCREGKLESWFMEGLGAKLNKIEVFNKTTNLN